LLIAALVGFGCAGDDDDDATPEPTSASDPDTEAELGDPPGEGASTSGQTPCPEKDGSSERTTTFTEPPPLCLADGTSYTATFVTNRGDIVIELDTENTPGTVNNFVVLARYGYYDNTKMFRTSPQIGIVQGGAPRTNNAADPGPGYTIQDEGDGYAYLPGDLVMARTPAPDSASAQYFFGAAPEVALLDGEPGNADDSGRGTYVTFGRTIEGLEILEEILSLHVDSDDPALAGGGPSEPVVVVTVAITEG